MLDPALALNAEVHLYPLQADLSPDLVALDLLLARIQKPVKALLATHYFGIVRDFCGLRQWCVDRHIVLIEDCSHVLFTENFRAPGSGIHGQFVVSSPYKFFACDDGGLLYAPDACLLENVATRSATFFEELRGIKHVLERGPVSYTHLDVYKRQLLILSGQDYTAKEFIEFVGTSGAWSGLTAAAKVRRIEVADADHTFSTRAWRGQVEDATLAWLDSLVAT